MPTVLDAFVVTLGLDPKQFGTGAAAANKQLDAFDKKVKALGLNEAKLDDTQKKAFKSLRDMATQSNRTGKELKATSAIGNEFWAGLEKGALGFGAALGVLGLAKFDADVVRTNAGLARLAPNMGMSAREADAWGKAISESVGGNADAARAALQGLSDELGGAQWGKFPVTINSINSLLGRRTGRTLGWRHQDGTPMGPDELLKQWADPIQQLGPQASHSLLAGILPDDIINLLGKGSGGVEAALATARKNTQGPGSYEDAEKLRKATANLTDAFTSLSSALVLWTAPRVTRDLKQALTTLRFAQGKLTYEEYKRKYQQAEDEYQGQPALDDQATKEAVRILNQNSPQQYDDPATQYARAHPTPGAPVLARTWTPEQREARLRELIKAGKSPVWAAEHVENEEAKGPPPSSSPAPAGPPLDLDLPAGTRGGRNNNPINLDFANQPGATGNPYTDAMDGSHHVMAKFATREAGIAAARAQIARYFAAGKNTIAAIYGTITGHAGSALTEHGIADISSWTGFAPGAALQPDQGTIDKLVAAISRQELGGDTTVHQNGPITIYAPGGHPRTIARGLNQELVSQLNTGPR